MTTSDWMKRCPYGMETKMRRLYAALARTTKPLPLKEVARRAKVTLRTTINMLVAMRSKFHGASLRRAGVEVAMVGDGFRLQARVPDPDARRPKGKARK